MFPGTLGLLVLSLSCAATCVLVVSFYQPLLGRRSEDCTFWASLVCYYQKEEMSFHIWSINVKLVVGEGISPFCFWLREPKSLG